MGKPLDRDKEIELMRTASSRHRELVRKWMSVPLIRAAFSEPAPGQPGTEDRFRREDKKIAIGK